MGTEKPERIIFSDETLVRVANDVDGYEALILKPHGKDWYILRQYDPSHGWGDRCYKTVSECFDRLYGGR